MADKWEIEGVRGELTNDTVFVRNTETGQRESVCTSTKRFFGIWRLTMIRYGPRRFSRRGVSDMIRRRLSSQGKR